MRNMKKNIVCLILLAGMLLAIGQAGVLPLELPDSLPYHEVEWLCAHNAMSNSHDGWWFPNQHWNIEEQLREGIHAQMWDVWEQEGRLVLRHGNGTGFWPGAIALSAALKKVRLYLEENPRAVITLILESYVDHAKLRKVFQESGMEPYCCTRPSGQAWTTLGDMRKTGKRLVVMTDRTGDEKLWPMPVWDYCVETSWKNVDVGRMLNALNRGHAGNGLFMVNHFIASLVPLVDHAAETNTLEALVCRAAALRKIYDRKVNFWVLDFVDVGEAAAFIRQRNVMADGK